MVPFCDTAVCKAECLPSKSHMIGSFDSVDNSVLCVLFFLQLMSYYGDRDRDRSRRPSRRLYVGNLNRYVRERDVERLFSKLGRVRDLALMSNFAFIEYDDERDAEDAVRNLHGTRLEGDRIIVEYAKNKPRGRGYDARGRNDKFGERCYNCGEVGHISRECSLPKGSGERAMRFEENRCFECGQPGHMARECPDRGGNGSNGGGGGGGGSGNGGRRRSRSPRSRSPAPARHSRRYSGEREDRSRYGAEEDRFDDNLDSRQFLSKDNFIASCDFQ